MLRSGAPAFVRSSIGAAGTSESSYRQFTLVLVHNHGKLLLGLKKRGFGAGYFNGFGGKVEPNETVLQAAHRELEEEAGIRAADMQACGRLFFVFDDKMDTPWEVHVFRVREYEGQPTESDEMRPQWFAPEDIPFEQMWADDTHWYPLFIAGKSFVGLFGFVETTRMAWHELRTVGSPGELHAADLLPHEQPQPAADGAGAS